VLFKHEANRVLAKSAQADWTAEHTAAAIFEAASWQDRVRRASECDIDRGDGAFVTRNELMPPLPSPIGDLLKAGLQATQVGRALLSPVLKHRRRR
jgi:hypothetical protein